MLLTCFSYICIEWLVVVIVCAKHSCFHKRIRTQAFIFVVCHLRYENEDCSIVSASDRHGCRPTCDDSVK